MVNKNIFKVDGEYIELMALLKAVGIAQTGGHAKMIVDEGNVIRNGSRASKTGQMQKKAMKFKSIRIHSLSVK